MSSIEFEKGNDYLTIISFKDIDSTLKKVIAEKCSGVSPDIVIRIKEIEESEYTPVLLYNNPTSAFIGSMSPVRVVAHGKSHSLDSMDYYYVPPKGKVFSFKKIAVLLFLILIGWISIQNGWFKSEELPDPSTAFLVDGYHGFGDLPEEYLSWVPEFQRGVLKATSLSIGHDILNPFTAEDVDKAIRLLIVEIKLRKKYDPRLIPLLSKVMCDTKLELRTRKGAFVMLTVIGRHMSLK